MSRILFVFALLLASCGLVEDERDEENKYSYITFSDQAFRAYCLEEFDADKDGRISRYEAQRIRVIVCPSRDIRSLYEIGEFARLESIDCHGNQIAELNLRKCTLLRSVNCSANALVLLEVNGLRGLTTLNCSANALSSLDLSSNASLVQFNARSNRLKTLDVTSCAALLRVNVRDNSLLNIIYCVVGQGVDADGNTTTVVR